MVNWGKDMMNWVGLRQSYLLGAFRGMAESERARRQMEAEGMEVVYAQLRSRVREEAAQSWTSGPLDHPDRFLDYTFRSADGPCRTARESLDSAVALLYQQRQAEYPYIVIVRLPHGQWPS
jgi:hypothetical protein